MNFDDARKQHLARLHEELMLLMGLAGDKEWRNFKCKEYDEVMEKIDRRLRAIVQINNVEHECNF